MKKKIWMLLALFVGTLGAWADNTVSVSSALIPQGRSGSFSIELTNTDAFASSMEIHLTLPEGITLQGVTLSNRFTDNPTLGKVVNGQAVTITTLSSENAPISGNSGPLVSFTVSADASLASGTVLTASITKMELAKKVGDKHEKWNPEPFNFDIEITDKVVLDENSAVVPIETNEDVDILVKRSIKANQWSTLCLPFDMTEEQVKAAFGDDVELAEFDTDEGYTVNADGTITVNFVDTDLADGLYGNWPYIIKTSSNISEFEVTAQLIPNEGESVAKYETGSGKKKTLKGTFTGTLHAGTVIPENNLFLSDNQFYYSAGKTKCKAFRAYFWFKDILPDVANASSRMLLHVGEGSSTAIKDINRETINNNRYYDLQGRRVDSAQFLRPFGSKRPEVERTVHGSQLKKGIYIRNGRKEVIK